MCQPTVFHPRLLASCKTHLEPTRIYELYIVIGEAAGAVKSSKGEFTNWPNKSLVEKNFRTFALKCNLHFVRLPKVFVKGCASQAGNRVVRKTPWSPMAH